MSAHFLHTTLEMDRSAILRRAAATVAPGGTLLIVDHGGAPPWAPEEVQHHEFPAPDVVLAGLALDDTEWERVRVGGTAQREVVGPEGQDATLDDNIIQLRRK